MVVGPVFAQSDFTAGLMNLLPRGPVWPRDPDSTQYAFWEAMAGTFKRNSDAAIGLLNDSPPFSLAQMLPDWETTLGLPDDCAPANQTVAQRVAAVIAKFARPGGQSQYYFLALAASLGYDDVTITQYAPFRAGRSSCGDSLGGPGWMFVWLVTVPDISVSYFSAGDPSGSPLYWLAQNQIQCIFEKYAPAHTNVLFAGL